MCILNHMKLWHAQHIASATVERLRARARARMQMKWGGYALLALAFLCFALSVSLQLVVADQQAPLPQVHRLYGSPSRPDLGKRARSLPHSEGCEQPNAWHLMALHQ